MKADMVPLIPESLLVHEKLTGAFPGSRVPVPVPMEVHAKSVRAQPDSKVAFRANCVDCEQGWVNKAFFIAFSLEN
jgi:hypothetical protein